jgi:hypothetical protein
MPENGPAYSNVLFYQDNKLRMPMAQPLLLGTRNCERRELMKEGNTAFALLSTALVRPAHLAWLFSTVL